MYPTRPSHLVVTGSKIIDAYYIENTEKIMYIKEMTGLKFMKAYYLMKKHLPTLLVPTWNGKRFDIPFKDLFIYNDLLKVNETYTKFDIKGAYRSILMSFFDLEVQKELQKFEKKDFLKAVGYSAFHKQVIEIKNMSVVSEKKNDRSDILNTCVEFLKYLGAKKDLQIIFQYVDCFIFNQKFENLSDIFEKIFLEWCNVTGLEKYLKNEPHFDFHIENATLFDKETIKQKYKVSTKLDFANVETGDIKTYYI